MILAGGEGQGKGIRALVLLSDNTYSVITISADNLFDNDYEYSEKTYSVSEDLYVKQLLSRVNHISNVYTYLNYKNETVCSVDIIMQADEIEDVLDFKEEIRTIMYHYQAIYPTTTITIYASNDSNLDTKYHKALFFNLPAGKLAYNNIINKISISQKALFLTVEDTYTSLDIEKQLQEPTFSFVYI